MSFKLLVENPAPKEEFEYIIEEKSSGTGQTLYIKGPYMMSDDVNRNKRFYPKDELQREVDRYMREMVKENRSMGELNHPTSAEVDLERACHMVTDLWSEGNMFYGKSKVLSTPCGQIVKSLINDGVKVGMSSRALGQLTEEKGRPGINRVSEMRLVAVDCVSDPSCPKAFVNGILESKQFILSTDGRWEEMYENFEKSISDLPKKEINEYLQEQVIKFLDKLG